MLLTGSKLESTLNFHEHSRYNKEDKTARNEGFKAKYEQICVCPQYYFQANPDGNVTEVTGEYTPKEGEFNE